MAKCIEENWTHRIERVKQLIKEWSKRDLSIQGKVVVIKTFLVSQFVFIMQSIGLPETVLNTLNTTFYKFLWQKKYSNRKAFEKIKRRVLEAAVDEGGLDMINMLELQNAFNLQWIGKLTSASPSNNWSLIPQWHLFKTGQPKVTHINCRTKDAIGLEKIENIFWKEVVSTYLNNKLLTNLSDITKHNFHNQSLFNNSLIKYKNRVLYFKSWQEKGIEKVKDLIHESGNRLLSLEEIQIQIGHNKAATILEYNALVNAIPNIWMQWIEEEEILTENSTDINDAMVYNTKPKMIRKTLISRREVTTPISYFFWMKKYNFAIHNETWSRAKDITKETRLRVLHWKILHNIYPTNILLNKMKVKDDNKCSYCRDSTDYIEHFFCDCPIVRGFWKYIEQKILIETNVSLKLSPLDILLGIDNSVKLNGNYKYINYLLLLGKMCISIYKKTESVFPIQLIFERELHIRRKGNDS